MDGIDSFGEVNSQEGGANPLAQFLGLYLVILAFFIALVSISSVENVRSKAVMDSLSSTFAASGRPSTSLTTFNALDGDALGGQRFQEQVTGLFSSAIQIVEIEVVQPGRDMRLKMPADRLFMPSAEAIKPDQIPLLDRIVTALSSAPPGLSYEMELVLGSDTVEGGALPIGETLAMKRIGSIARELRGRGAPDGSIAVGLGPSRPDELVVRFFVRPLGDGQTIKPAEPAGGGARGNGT